MYQNPAEVISYFENLANLNCKFHTTKTLLNSTIISSHPSNMRPSKKCKTSTTTKAVVNKGHDGRTDVDVNGSIAAGVRIVDAAPIGGANATGNPTIEVNIANTTNVTAASKTTAATLAATSNAIAAAAADANDAIQTQQPPLTLPLQPQHMPLTMPLKPPRPLLGTQPTKRTLPMWPPLQMQMPLTILLSRLTS
jgi:hypothetical protein